MEKPREYKNHEMELLQPFNITHIPLALMVSDMSHPAKKSLSIELVNGEFVLFEELIKLQANQFYIDVRDAFFAHDQPFVLGQPAPSFPRIVVPHVESSC